MYLYQKPADLRNVPDIIPDPAKLVTSVRQLIIDHEDDCPESAVTGKYILKWTRKDNVDIDFKTKRLIPKPKRKLRNLKNPFTKNYKNAMAHMRSVDETITDAPKKRRRRCMECTGCKEEDCKVCDKCRDMVKYGGLGRLRQSCVKRRCLQPQLPVAASCSRCGMDGRYQTPDHKKVVDYKTSPPNLFECILCFDIRHPECVDQRGEVIPSLSNCWKCTECTNKTNEPEKMEEET